MRSLYICILTVVTISHILAQQSGSQFTRTGIINANNAKTVFGNWGVIGQPAEMENRGAWLYPTNGYIGDLSFMVGVELPGEPQVIHSVITCPFYPTQRPAATQDRDPITNNWWTFEPVTGFFNPNQGGVATNTDKSTWPSSWPDRPDLKDSSGSLPWNGLFGTNRFFFDQESFYVVDDNNDLHFSIAANNSFGVAFKPDSTNSARNGQGIRVSVRLIESNYPLLKDVLFLTYDIKNEGTHDYSKVVFGQLMGNYIGVTSTEDYGEYNNDVMSLFKGSNFVLNSNFVDTTPNPLWVGRIGKFGHAFVEAPNNNHIASYNCLDPSNQVSLGNDELLWQQLTPGTYKTPAAFQDSLHPTSGEDADYLCGTEYFSIASGTTKRIATVLAYGYSKEEIELKVELARMMWNLQFDSSSASSKVTLADFTSGDTVSGTQTIRWTTALSNSTADIWFTPDAGRNWTKLVAGIPNNGSFDWNTSAVSDCSFGMIRILVKDSTGHARGYSDSPALFTVDNPGNGVPTMQVLQMSFPDSTSDSVSVSVRVGDPEAQSLTLTTYYTTNSLHPWVECQTQTIPSNRLPLTLTIPVRSLPNSDNFALKFIASDGSLVSADSTSPFRKQSSHTSVAGNVVRHAAGQATTTYAVHVVDNSKLTGDTYLITFDDTSSFTRKTMSVFDRTKATILYQGEPLISNTESVPFDGLTLLANDFPTHVDTTGIRWNRAMPASVTTTVQRLSTMTISPDHRYEGYNAACDYTIAFSNVVVDTSADVPNFAPSFLQKFSIINTTLKKRIKVTGVEDAGFLDIIFMENGPGTLGMTWEIYLQDRQNPDGPLPMLPGDTLFITTTKGFSYRDTLSIDSKLLAAHRIETTPGTFRLDQNFPNPFNPTTVISYQLPAAGHATLKIFDLLGREVVTLVDQEKPAGVYRETWNASRMASGVYFCRLNNGTFTQTRKLLLIE